MSLKGGRGQGILKQEVNRNC